MFENFFFRTLVVLSIDADLVCIYSGSVFRLKFLFFIIMESFISTVKTKQQMACEYGVSRKTFHKLLQKRHIILNRGLIYPKDQEAIYNELGFPESIQKGHKVPNSSQ